MRSVIFISPPCAGKGTFSDYLVKNYNYSHISTGDMLRDASKTNAHLNELMKTGELIPDELVLEMLEEKLKEIPKTKPFILDGLPRTLHQAEVLDIILNGLKLNDYIVVYIDVEKELLFKRVTGRRTCPNCHKTYNLEVEEFKPKNGYLCDNCASSLITRSDDTIEAYSVRYKEFMDNTYPLVDYYQKKNRLKVVKNEVIPQTMAINELVGILSD